jgi:hypothetical protein
VERGELGDVKTIAWVVEIAGQPVEIGLLGAAAEVQPTAHLLLARGMRALEL